MKSSRNRIGGAAVAAVVLAAMTLTGCTGSGGSGGLAPAGPAKTFTGSDLLTILNAANATLNANGTVSDNGLISDHPELNTSLYSRIKAQGGTMSPAECGPLFNKVTADLLTLGNDPGAFSAKLVYGSNVLGATSSSKPLDDAALGKLVGDDIDAMATKCATMHFTFSAGSTQQYTLTFSKETAKTHAGFTAAYSEVTTVGASSTHTVEVVGIDGNLLVGYAGISSAATLADGVSAVNAVVDAAKRM